MKLAIVHKITHKEKTFNTRPDSFEDAESMIWENRRYIDEWDFILYGTKNRKYRYSDEDPDFDYWKLIV
jgi:hypothetical protein